MKLKALFQVVSIGLILTTALASAPTGEAASLAAQSSSLDTCGAPRGREAARAKAHLLVEQIRADLAEVEDQIRDVEFVTQVEAGTASVELIAAVVAEEYSIIQCDLKSFKRMAARWDSRQGSHFFGDLAFGEALAQPLVLDFAETVGLAEEDLVAYEPRPRSQTYPSRVAWIASHADRASAAASFLVNFGVFGENMARVRDALVDVYRFTPAEVEFFSFFAEPIPGFEDDAIEVIADGLRQGACPRDVRPRKVPEKCQRFQKRGRGSGRNHGGVRLGRPSEAR